MSIALLLLALFVFFSRRSSGARSRLTVAAAVMIAGSGALLPRMAFAQFSLAVSPPRLELSVRPGESARDVIELTNSDARVGAYKVKTADWTLQADSSVEFSDALQPQSCRPWVSIERRDVKVAPGRPYRYRFEVSTPAGTVPIECRFAIMIEGEQPAAAPGVPIALSARIGVLVYLDVGDVAPALELVSTSVQIVDGRPAAVLQIRNIGTAHGRLAGFLSGKDASGAALEFQPANTPILPGETRDIALQATRPGDVDTPVVIQFPVAISGTLEWGKDGSLPVTERFTR